MADKNENSELVDKLKEEFESHLKGVYEKNKDYKYGDALNAENLEEVCKLCVLTALSSA